MRPLQFSCLLSLSWLALACGSSDNPDGVLVDSGVSSDGQSLSDSGTSDAPNVRDPRAEVTPVLIPLDGPLASSASEVSGLAWKGDTLVFLPERLGASGSGESVYTLSREDIHAFLDSGTPLSPTEVPVVETGAYPLDFTPSGNDYEGIVFVGDKSYLLNGDGRYFMSGTMDASALTLDLGLATDTGTGPLTESILSWEESLVIFREFNDAGATARLFDTDLGFENTVPLTPTSYRLTDVTEPDSNGKFWAINYRFPPEGGPWPDELATTFGQGPTHELFDHVERLVEFQITAQSVVRTSEAPIQLSLESAPRNWEGIVRLEGRGFLIITDLFPQPTTTFAFIPFP